MAAADDDEVRLKAGADALLHDLAAGSVGLHDDGRADELLGLVQHGALGDEEAEGAVRLAADAEHGGVREGLAAEVHGRADLAVRVHADDGAGVAPREGAGRHAAVPVGDAALVFIERHGVAEEHRLAGQLHAHPHGQRAVGVRLAGGGHAGVVQHGEHRAHGRAEGGEEIGPAARGERADAVFLHIVGIGLQQTRVVELVFLRRLVEACRAALGLKEILRALFVAVALGALDQLARLDGLQLHAEGAHHLAVERAAEAEALGRVADGGDGERAHGLLELRRAVGGLHRGNDALLLRRAEAPVEGLAVKGGEGVRGGVGARQGVEAQSSAVDHGLAQRPEQHRAVKPAQHLRHEGGVGEGEILEHDEIRVLSFDELAQLVEAEQHLVRADKVRIHRAQHGAGALKLILRGLQMVGGHAHRNIDSIEIHMGTSKQISKLINAVKQNMPTVPPCQAFFTKPQQ